MSVRKRAIPRREQPDLELTSERAIDLICGFPLYPANPFRDDEHRARVWRRHEAAILAGARDIEPGLKTYEPGTRPVAWWSYSAPEPRRQVSGPRGLELTVDLYRGIPAIWPDRPERLGVVFETERAYLERLDLLLPGEEEELEDIDRRASEGELFSHYLRAVIRPVAEAGRGHDNEFAVS